MPHNPQAAIIVPSKVQIFGRFNHTTNEIISAEKANAVYVYDTYGPLKKQNIYICGRYDKSPILAK